MRTVFSLLLPGLVMLLSACTSVVFPEPLGKPVPASDELEKFLVGEWQGEKDVIWTVVKEPGSEFFTAKSAKDGEKDSRFVVRHISEGTHILWAEDKEHNGYIPMRMAGADEGVALLYPDDKAVEKLVAEGKLKGVYDKAAKAWMIAKGNWEEVLAGKDFWLLDHCLPFVRRPQTPTPAPTPPPASEPALPPVMGPGK